MFRQVATWRKLTKWPDEISVLNFWIFVIQIENLIYQNLQDDVAKIIQYIGKNGKNETLRKLTKFKFLSDENLHSHTTKKRYRSRNAPFLKSFLGSGSIWMISTSWFRGYQTFWNWTMFSHGSWAMNIFTLKMNIF